MSSLGAGGRWGVAGSASSGKDRLDARARYRGHTVGAGPQGRGDGRC